MHHIPNFKPAVHHQFPRYAHKKRQNGLTQSIRIPKTSFTISSRLFTTQNGVQSAYNTKLSPSRDLFVCYSPNPHEKLLEIFPEYISQQEHDSLVSELEPILKKKKFQSSHWDKVITGFRELEKANWTASNAAIFQRIKDMFPDTAWLYGVHVLDLAEEGYIGPHVDSVKFSGRYIIGLCLLSSSIMRLTHVRTKDKIDLLLRPRSLYVLRDELRYEYDHEILPSQPAPTFKGEEIKKSRRISLMLRDQPPNSPPGPSSYTM
mmetsp:Transcript_29606/g.41660  ORF Transcript_29606/g.41660 Transcript_29606/m.41660 type:complete len:262 (+) Transcript_29606:115-900(+)|eukprot:CAMPEP_0168560164 /NCGR_PEP_ID=MMETSP0413-20121227/10912_1 /TAXON_ID=136452 /ORGANISM="Filamoeba nolandi, Strain NC-AS-23-1" /LENGTH=261 /DNA_ID=CAMNT_0008591443 /DNA_START=46 /DNA_END=831 /DNA_ORIENTATION=-